MEYGDAMIWSLQILRFIAALMVVYVHAAGTAFTVTGSAGIIPVDLVIIGASGVDIFFVLSGVVIAKTASGMTASQFAWRRVRRILPIYFAALVAYLPLLIIRASGGEFGWRDAVSTLLLWPATDAMTLPLLPVAWTLSFEMLFYLSAVLVLYDRRWLYVLGALYALAFSLRQFGPVFQFVGNPLVLEFLFGVVIASAPKHRSGALAIPLGFAALAAAGFLHIAPRGDAFEFLIGLENVQRVFVYGIPSTLIVYGFMQLKTRESVWTRLGDASYSLYLFHPVVLGAMLLLFMQFPIQADAIVFVGMAVSVAFSWRAHVIIEKPILEAIPTSILIAGTRRSAERL
jgi:exopolysaccharide production protein ExoZ